MWGEGGVDHALQPGGPRLQGGFLGEGQGARGTPEQRKGEGRRVGEYAGDIQDLGMCRSLFRREWCYAAGTCSSVALKLSSSRLTTASSHPHTQLAWGQGQE